MTNGRMMKKRGREGMYCDNRHCVSPSDAMMSGHTQSRQRQRERREWEAEWDWTEEDD